MSCDRPALDDGFRIGPWQVRPRLGRIAGPTGGSKRLPRRAMALLQALAEAGGESLSPDELRRRGGPLLADATPADLLRAGRRLRRALGDDPRRPRYIALPGRTGEATDGAATGYRLVAPAMPEDDGHGTFGRTPSATRRMVPFALVAALLVMLALGGLVRLVGGLLTPPPVVVRELPFEIVPGSVPALSPDGSRLAVVQAEAGGRLALLDLTVPAAAPQPLPPHDGRDAYPIFSADGRRLIFVRRSPRLADGRGESAILSLDLPLDLPVPGSADPLPEPRLLAVLGEAEVAGLAFAPRNRLLAAALRDRPGEPFRIAVIPLNDPSPRFLTSPPEGSLGDRTPVFSPEGSQLAFRRRQLPGIDQLMVVPVAGGRARPLSPRSLPAGGAEIPGLAWESGGSSLLFTLFADGSFTLRRYHLLGRGSERLGANDGFGAGAYRLAAVEGRLVYSRRGRQRWALWALDGGPGAVAGQPSPSPDVGRRLQGLTAADSAPALSPDGRRLALVSPRSGSWELWSSAAGGDDARRLTNFGGPLIASPRWSPDGAGIVFTSPASGSFDLWWAAADGSRVVRLTDHPAAELSPVFSPDGRWLYFTSDRSGSWQIWRRSAPGAADGAAAPAAAEQVGRGGAFRAEPTGAGRWLIVADRGVPGLWRLPADPPAAGAEGAGGADRRRPISTLCGGEAGWGNVRATEVGIYCIAPAPGGEVGEASGDALYLIPIPEDDGAGAASPAAPRLLARLPAPAVHPGLAATPDGRTVRLLLEEEIAEELVLVEEPR